MATIVLESPEVLPRDTDTPDTFRGDAYLSMLKNRTPEEVEADRAEMLLHSPIPRPLPLGKTFAETVRDAWPSGDTDREIEDALRLIE